MNTKGNIFTRGEVVKYCFWCSFGEIKNDLTLEKSNILYISENILTLTALFGDFGDAMTVFEQ